MTILGIEFSTDLRSVAVWRDTRVAGYAEEAGGRATPAFRLLEAALRQAGVKREEVDAIAVGLGPGSYAGVRVAIAIAEGWRLASGARLIGLSSADVLAETVRAGGQRGRIDVVIDAQRGEFYRATYDLTDLRAELRTPLQLATRDDVLAAGDAGRVGGADVAQLLPGVNVVAPSARALACLAAARTAGDGAAALSPIYLRSATFVKAPPPRPVPER